MQDTFMHSCALVIPNPIFPASLMFSAISCSTSNGRTVSFPGLASSETRPVTQSDNVDLGTVDSLAVPLIDEHTLRRQLRVLSKHGYIDILHLWAFVPLFCLEQNLELRINLNSRSAIDGRAF